MHTFIISWKQTFRGNIAPLLYVFVYVQNLMNIVNKIGDNPVMVKSSNLSQMMSMERG